MSKFVPKTPEILNKIRLPELDFVDVYNQPPSQDDYVDLEEDTTPDPVRAKAWGGGRGNRKPREVSSTSFWNCCCEASFCACCPRFNFTNTPSKCLDTRSV